MRALSKPLSGIEESVSREINPHVFTDEDFANNIEYYLIENKKFKKKFPKISKWIK